MSIKRYSIESGIYSPPTGPLLRSKLDVAETEDGSWVKYNDHVTEVERLTAADREHRRVLGGIYRALGTDNPDRETWAEAITRLTADLAAARAQADGLAEALRRCIGSLGVATSAGPDHPDVEFARATLAALPKMVEDDAVPPDAVVMRYGDKSVTITNLALPKEEA